MGHDVRFGEVWMGVESDQGSPWRAASRRPAPSARAAFDTKVCVPPDISNPATSKALSPLTWAFKLGE